ncbi:unnamed protein product [Urochloa decumbens]|uniref:RING-type domain-containing protein n=1 Tax=Urochloa decumbens TaxID=240449 RepID=A0ABC8WMT6_9POAL
MDGDENASPAVGADERLLMPDAQEGSSAEPCPYVDMLRYYRARRQFRFGRFLAPTRFPDDAWMRFTDDESVADAVYRNGQFGAILAFLEEEAAAVRREGDETSSSWEGSIMMDSGDDDDDVSPTMADDDPGEEPVVEFDFERFLRTRQVHFHHLSAPTGFPPAHDASYTHAMDDMLRLRESNFFSLGNGQPAPPDPDGGAAYRNGGFGAVPAAEEAIAALPETTVGDGEGEMTGRRECAVCLEAYKAGDTLRTMPCSHGFHEHCIFGWLAVSLLCPLCRFAMPAAEEEAEPFSFMG